MKKTKRKTWKCHDCDAKEGEIHEYGCDMEVCPICGGQLLGCECLEKTKGLLPFRIPYLLIPNMCRLCGKQWPDFFKVSDKTWKKYVIPPLQKKVLCKDCYQEMKKLFPNCNHHHTLNKNYKIVNFGDGKFVANKEAIPLLKALNELGLRTRTHHIDNKKHAFISILLDNVELEIRTVNEHDADRTIYNGKKELLIMWEK